MENKITLITNFRDMLTELINNPDENKDKINIVCKFIKSYNNNNILLYQNKYKTDLDYFLKNMWKY